ncbi:MAG TPA: c-type cytochrome [Methylibium sp.]|nr:c-type cytochrome [Methylibium sp.]
MLARSLILAAAALAGTAARAEGPGDALYVRALAATCANCHGTDGKSLATAEGLPRLAGLQKAYIVEQLTAFRDGKRSATVMHQLVKGYTPAQIDAIAAYFAAQPK